MKMNFDTGTIITIVAVLLFYFRLIILQRQRIKKAQYQYAQVSSKNAKKKNSKDKNPEVRYSRLGVQIKNWWVVAGAIVLITFGAVVVGTHFLGTALSTFWWIPTVIGIGLFAIDLK
jgi:ABC-type Fe3+ transport system permease subunit